MNKHPTYTSLAPDVSLLLISCDLCGAVVHDAITHDYFHKVLNRTESMAFRAGGIIG